VTARASSRGGRMGLFMVPPELARNRDAARDFMGW
jgi:hypothetical protein